MTVCTLYSVHHELISRDRPEKCCVFIKELNKIHFTFCFAAWSFLQKGIGGVSEDYSIENKIRNIANLYTDSMVAYQNLLSQKSINLTSVKKISTGILVLPPRAFHMHMRNKGLQNAHALKKTIRLCQSISLYWCTQP